MLHPLAPSLHAHSITHPALQMGLSITLCSGCVWRRPAAAHLLSACKTCACMHSAGKLSCGTLAVELCTIGDCCPRLAQHWTFEPTDCCIVDKWLWWRMQPQQQLLLRGNPTTLWMHPGSDKLSFAWIRWICMLLRVRTGCSHRPAG